MTRAFITLLLLAVFFMSGMLFGMDNGQQEQPDNSAEKRETQQETQMEMSENSDNQAESNHEVETIEVVDDPDPDMNSDRDSKQFTQTSAAFLGSIIQGFYELVITVFYQIVQLFF